MLPEPLGYLLVFILGGVCLPFLVSIASNLSTPWAKARIDRILARYGRWANDQKTKTLTALDKQDAEIRRLHDDTGALLRYLCFQMAGIFYASMMATLVLFVAGYINPLTGSNDSAFGLTPERFNAITFAVIALVSILVGLLWAQVVLDKITSVYRFEKWQEYVAKRRAQLTKDGAVNS